MKKLWREGEKISIQSLSDSVYNPPINGSHRLELSSKASYGGCVSNNVRYLNIPSFPDPQRMDVVGKERLGNG